MADFRLPDLGEGVTEAEIERWLGAEGDEIAEDDPLVEVITDKATAEIPSPFAGTVTRIHVGEGETAPVGSVLVSIGNHLDTPPPAATDAIPDLPVSDEVAAGPGGSLTPRSGNGSVKAMPPVRRLARDLGVDLHSVRGTGPEGQILRGDVEAAVEDPPSTPTAAQVPGPANQHRRPRVAGEQSDKREPLRGVRRRIAERMTQAHLSIPPVTHVEECDVTELEATRRLANERAPDEVKLTFLPFIVKAVSTALRDYPALNASLDEKADEIVFRRRLNIGVAVDTEAGLIVPVIKDAGALRLREIAEEIDRLAASARDGSISPEELRDGTFTVTSPGPFGGLMATPIVMHPQSAILGVHRAGDRAVVRDGQIVVRLMMNLSITFDHRLLDGMTAARFILDVVRLLEHPAVLALEN